MRHTVYWATLTTEHGGADLFVNDLPVVRLGPTAVAARPLNEYLRAGANRLSVRAGDGYRTSGADETPPPQALSIKVEAVEFLDADEIGRRTLAEAAGSLRPAPPGTPLVEAGFDAGAVRGGIGALDEFQPLGPPELALVTAKLDEVAGWWRTGDADALLAWLDRYVREFVGSYATETEGFFRAGFAQMVADFAASGAQVRFDPGATLLERCGDGRLADCRRRGGTAAITVHSEAMPDYDFNVVVGVRGGDVIALR